MMEHGLSALLEGVLSSLRSAGLGSFIDGAKKALDDEVNKLNPVKEVGDDLKNWAKNQFENWMPDASELQRIENDIKGLLSDVNKWGSGVVSDINSSVQNALSSGQTPAQTDGGLSQTHDDFTPQGQVPVETGPLPGMGSEAAGMSRSSGGTGGYDGGYGGSGSSGPSQGGTPTPIGGSGTSSGTSNTGSGGTTAAPTASDLGVDPNSGATIEYQPGNNQAVVTYPDGTTEIKPWPAQ
jgi:hypothetical protein